MTAIHGRQLILLPASFTIHRLAPNAMPPASLLRQKPWFMARTEEELSIVCPSDVPLESDRAEPGWVCFKVVGPLAFEEVGILARLSGIMAGEKISIFAVSTFDTDYILIRRSDQERALGRLRASGYIIEMVDEPGRAS